MYGDEPYCLVATVLELAARVILYGMIEYDTSYNVTLREDSWCTVQ